MRKAKAIAIAVLTLALCASFTGAQSLVNNHPELIKDDVAYTSFFIHIHNLMERDVKIADSVIAQQHFNPSDTALIEGAVTNWYQAFQEEETAWLALPEAQRQGALQQTHLAKLSKIVLGAASQLEAKLENGKHFHNMIQGLKKNILP